MNAEQELVFAKYLVGIGAAEAAQLKSCLRAQALRSAEGERVALTDLLIEERVIDAGALRSHLAQFEARMADCARCGAWFYRPSAYPSDACPRCLGTESSKTGMTGQFRRAQQGLPPATPSEPPARPAGAPAPGGGLEAPITAFGDYDIIEAVARGGMGVVYKARHRVLGRVVALKVLREGQRSSESHVKRFQREARSVGKLVHPHIVPVHELGHENGQYFFTMDFVEGPSFEKVLADPERDFRRGVEVIRDVARGLACAHEHGVIHRDIKPANILLDPSGAGKVTDFGLARSTEHQSALTQEGELIGTPLYMSPEQVRGRVQEIDERSDTYSLGVVLYQHATGRLPFLAQTMVDLQYRILHEEVPAPRAIDARVDAALETIILKCLEKERDARYQTARELADDLDRWLSGKRIVARAPSVQGRLFRRVKRHKHLAVAGLLIALGLGLGGAGLAWREWRSRTDEALRRTARAREELDAAVRALKGATEAAIEQAATELRRGNAVEAREALERARLQLEDIAALTAPELAPSEVHAVKHSAGLAETRRRWLLGSARADAAYRSTEALERARARLAELVAEAPGELDGWLTYAEVLAARGALDEADQALGQALALSPGHLEARRMRGLLALEREHWGDADVELTAVIDALEADGAPPRRAELASLHVSRAAARRRLRRAAEAEQDLARALELAPSDARAYTERGELMRQRGQRFQAAQDFDRAVELADEDAVEPLLGRARFLIEQGYFLRAREDLETALAANDALLEAYLWRGVTGYFGLDEIERALTGRATTGSEDDLVRVTAAAARDPELAAEAWRWIGRLRRAQGRAADAVAAYRRARALGPRSVEALVGLGRAALDAGDLEAARGALAEALAVEPGSPAALTGLGLVALAEGDPRQAVAHLDGAVERAPAEVEALTARARARERLGEVGPAREDDRAALAARIEAADVRGFFRQGRKHLGLADKADATHLMREGELKRAEHAFTLCVRLAPLHARAHVERARVYERMGQTARAQALEACASALEANPLALEAYVVRARVRLAGGSAPEVEDALAGLGKAIALGADRPEVRRLAGRAELRLGRAAEAVRHLEVAVRQAPGDAEGFALLAEALRAAGRAADAEQAARRAKTLGEGGLGAEVRGLVERAERLLAADAAGAARLLGEAIALEPAAGELYLERSIAHLFAIDQQAAMRDLAAAVERSPALLARMCERLSELTAALDWDEAFRRAQAASSGANASASGALSPPSPAFLRGFLYVLRVESGQSADGDTLQGVDAFTEVLEEEPTSASAYCLRGLLLLRAGDLNAAKNDLATAVLLDGQTSAAHVYLAGMHTQRARFDLALSTLDKALELGYRDRTQLLRDPALAPLRQRPEWKSIIERASGG